MGWGIEPHPAGQTLGCALGPRFNFLLHVGVPCKETLGVCPHPVSPSVCLPGWSRPGGRRAMALCCLRAQSGVLPVVLPCCWALLSIVAWCGAQGSGLRPPHPSSQYSEVLGYCRQSACVCTIRSPPSWLSAVGVVGPSLLGPSQEATSALCSLGDGTPASHCGLLASLCRYGCAAGQASGGLFCLS